MTELNGTLEYVNGQSAGHTEAKTKRKTQSPRTKKPSAEKKMTKAELKKEYEILKNTKNVDDVLRNIAAKDRRAHEKKKTLKQRLMMGVAVVGAFVGGIFAHDIFAGKQAENRDDVAKNVVQIVKQNAVATLSQEGTHPKTVTVMMQDSTFKDIAVDPSGFKADTVYKYDYHKVEKAIEERYGSNTDDMATAYHEFQRVIGMSVMSDEDRLAQEALEKQGHTDYEPKRDVAANDLKMLLTDRFEANKNVVSRVFSEMQRAVGQEQHYRKSKGYHYYQ